MFSQSNVEAQHKQQLSALKGHIQGLLEAAGYQLHDMLPPEGKNKLSAEDRNQYNQQHAQNPFYEQLIDLHNEEVVGISDPTFFLTYRELYPDKKNNIANQRFCYVITRQTEENNQPEVVGYIRCAIKAHYQSNQPASLEVTPKFYWAEIKHLVIAKSNFTLQEKHQLAGLLLNLGLVTLGDAYYLREPSKQFKAVYVYPGCEGDELYQENHFKKCTARLSKKDLSWKLTLPFNLDLIQSNVDQIQAQLSSMQFAK